MNTGRYWSVEHCRWEPCRPHTDVHWSVQRCRWEPADPVADALATPWSVFVAAQDGAGVPEQRRPQGAPVQA
ncbi:MAG: hypothetical protein KY440_13595 [Actinobacteria bacterium]|nr:hypothetical protein [Actinomycetota bacterium]